MLIDVFTKMTAAAAHHTTFPCRCAIVSQVTTSVLMQRLCSYLRLYGGVLIFIGVYHAARQCFLITVLLHKNWYWTNYPTLVQIRSIS